MSGLVRLVAPSGTALSIDDAIAHLRLEDDAPDVDLVEALCAAADRHVEQVTRRCLLTQQWRLTLDAFPCTDDPTIRLPLAPVASVQSVTYVDTAGATQTLSAGAYQVDVTSLPPRLLPAPGTSWPRTREGAIAAVAVTFTAGYGANTAVPADLKSALRLLLGHLYENREAVVTGTIVTTVPLAVEALLAPHRVLEAA